MGKYYSEDIKKTMVQKLASPGAKSAAMLSEEVGIPQPTLSRWLREYGNIGDMKQKKNNYKNMTAEEKLKLVIEYKNLSEDKRGEFLRKNGLYSSYIDEWEKEMLTALSIKPANSKRKKDPKDIKIQELEKELRRKDKALAETAALLVLKKKVDLIFEDQKDEK
jgi:transposase